MPKSKAKKLAKKLASQAVKAVRTVAANDDVKALVGQVKSLVKQQAKNRLLSGVNTVLGTRLRGNGDYYTSSNIHSSGRMLKSAMSVSSSVTIEREEYIGKVISNATAKQAVIESYRINPGSLVTFPWGSSVALGYESWEPLGMQIVFDSTSGNALNSVDTSLGKVAIAIQYNTFANPWDTFNEVENANDSCTVVPSDNMIVGVECKSSLRGAKTLYVSTSAPSTAGRAFYDIGDFYVASTGCQGTSVVLGDLKIRYRIRLFNPIINSLALPPMIAQVSGNSGDTSTAFHLSGAVFTSNLADFGGYVTIADANTLVYKFNTNTSALLMTIVYQRFDVGMSLGSVSATASYHGGPATTLVVPPTVSEYGGAIGFKSAGLISQCYTVPAGFDQVNLVIASGSGGTVGTPIGCWVTFVRLDA